MEAWPISHANLIQVLHLWSKFWIMAHWYALDRIWLHLLRPAGVESVSRGEYVLIQRLLNDLRSVIHGYFHALLQALRHVLCPSTFLSWLPILLPFVLKEEAKVFRYSWELIQLYLLVDFMYFTGILGFESWKTEAVWLEFGGLRFQCLALV